MRYFHVSLRIRVRLIWDLLNTLRFPSLTPEVEVGELPIGGQGIYDLLHSLRPELVVAARREGARCVNLRWYRERAPDLRRPGFLCGLQQNTY